MLLRDFVDVFFSVSSWVVLQGTGVLTCVFYSSFAYFVSIYLGVLRCIGQFILETFVRLFERRRYSVTYCRGGGHVGCLYCGLLTMWVSIGVFPSGHFGRKFRR